MREPSHLKNISLILFMIFCLNDYFFVSLLNLTGALRGKIINVFTGFEYDIIN